MNPEESYLLKGYYLAGDVHHDFGEIPVKYNYGGDGAVIDSLDEDKVVSTIENAKYKNGIEFIQDGTARRAKRLIFTIPTKTETFKESSVPRLWAGGNQQIGIVQDAGKFITPDLGAKHVLTFGSILDPARKPVEPASKPIWFKPTDDLNSDGITIPLTPFGFADDKIEAIKVRNLRAGPVSSTFVLPGRELDAVTMRPVVEGQALGQKPINYTEIEVAGFYTSIEKAKDIEEFFLQKPADQRLASGLRYLFNVGKTLGDLTLVASCMPRFNNGTANIYQGIGSPRAPDRDQPGWLNWANGDPVDPPAVLMLKTGDRLNALRAQMENVPCIYEQQKAKGRSVKQYIFTPGQADPTAILNAMRNGYTDLIQNVTRRYDELIQNFRNCLTPGTTSLNPAYTIFTENPVIPENDAVALQIAGRVILEIISVLEVLKTKIVEWLGKNQQSLNIQLVGTVEAQMEQIEPLQTMYNRDIETSTRVSPQTTNVVYTKGGTTKVMLKIVVSQLPKVLPATFTCPLNVSLDISLWNAFSGLKGKRPEQAVNALFGKDLHKRFILPLGTLPAVINIPPDSIFGGLLQQQGGAPTEEELQQIAIEEDNLLGEYVLSNSKREKLKGGGGQEGGAVTIKINYTNFIKVFFNENNVFNQEKFYDFFPLIHDFWQYIIYKLEIVSYFELFVGCYSVYLGRNSGTIIDEIVRNQFLREFNGLYSGSNPFVTFEGGKETPKGNSTAGIDIFNAFISNTNLGNATGFGFIGDIPPTPVEATEPVFETNANIVESSAVMFAKLEAMFIMRAKTGVTDYMPITFNRTYITPRSGTFADTVRLGFRDFVKGPKKINPKSVRGIYDRQSTGRYAAIAKMREERTEGILEGTRLPIDASGGAAASYYDSYEEEDEGVSDAASGAAEAWYSSEFGNATGGLRTRRPLYSNVQVPDTVRSESIEHPRLQQRSRTRRTTGVRRSTRKSKTR